MRKHILRFLVGIFFHLIFSIFQTSLISNVHDCYESWSFDFSFVDLCFKDVKSFLSVMINQWNMLMMPLQTLGLTERFQSWLVVKYSVLAADSRCPFRSREIVLCCSLCTVWVMSGDELFLSPFSCAEHRLLTLPPQSETANREVYCNILRQSKNSMSVGNHKNIPKGRLDLCLKFFILKFWHFRHWS